MSDRWRDRPEGPNLEDRAGELFRAAQPQELPLGARVRIQASLADKGRRQLSVRYALAGVTAALLVVSSIAGATSVAMRSESVRAWFNTRFEAKPKKANAGGGSVLGGAGSSGDDAPSVNAEGAPRLEAPAPELSAPVAAPELATPELSQPELSRPSAASRGGVNAPRPPRHPAPSSILPAAPEPAEDASALPAEPAPLAPAVETPAIPRSPEPLTESALGRESALLRSALTKLEAGDATGALAALDAHAAAFPAGALGGEARIARIKALLTLGRGSEALTILEQIDPAGSVRGHELYLLRAELRASLGQLPRAIADFDAVLSSAEVPGALKERARYGRGASFARLGDKARARADFEAYLSEFPSGRFVGKARQALGR